MLSRGPGGGEEQGRDAKYKELYDQMFTVFKTNDGVRYGYQCLDEGGAEDSRNGIMHALDWEDLSDEPMSPAEQQAIKMWCDAVLEAGLE